MVVVAPMCPIIVRDEMRYHGAARGHRRAGGDRRSESGDFRPTGRLQTAVPRLVATGRAGAVDRQEVPAAGRAPAEGR